MRLGVRSPQGGGRYAPLPWAILSLPLRGGGWSLFHCEVHQPDQPVDVDFCSRGYEFCQRGVLKNSGRSCRTGESGVTLRTCWSANQQVGLREMLEKYDWSHSPLSRMSTGAKHLHGDRPAYLSACKRLTRFRPSA